MTQYHKLINKNDFYLGTPEIYRKLTSAWVGRNINSKPFHWPLKFFKIYLLKNNLLDAFKFRSKTQFPREHLF